MGTGVVFDSNVWELIADEAKKAQESHSIQGIHGLITSQVINPLIFEGIVNYESIPKKGRKAFIQNYRAGMSFSVDGEEEHTTLGTPAATVSAYLNDTVGKAVVLGFRFIHLPRIGAPRHELANRFKAPDLLELADRLERSFECARYIASLGCGKAALMDALLEPQDGLSKAIQDDPISEKKFSNGVAEWMDGDALAATYGYGHRYFCTLDRGVGAGSQSIFHPKNRSLFMQKYDVQILTPDELVNALSA